LYKLKIKMNDKINELILKIKAANNILVSVNRDPSLDQLAACIALTLFINKLNKHGSGVFSGQVPDTIDFLKPDKTLEKNTNSLRDFIISLSKDKADKLRYKPDGDKVKIFITPYRTSISEADLEFSQGDFNVDLVLVLGAVTKQDLDQAITVNERILHDASVVTINTTHNSDLGAINILDPESSSLCELVAYICIKIDQSLLDEQIATALLTGIVAETERFSNQKTTANTLSISSSLLASGANQKLVADQLTPKIPQFEKVVTPAADNLPPADNMFANNVTPAADNLPPIDNTLPEDDGRLVINHDDDFSQQKPEDKDVKNVFQQAESIGQVNTIEGLDQPQAISTDNNQSIINNQIDQQEPSPITANIKPEPLDPALDVLSEKLPQTENVENFSLPSSINFNVGSEQSNKTDNPVPENFKTPNSNFNNLTNSFSMPAPISSDDEKLNTNNLDNSNQIKTAQEAVKQVFNDVDSSDKPLPPVMALNAQRLGEIDHNDQSNSDDNKVEYNGEISIGDNGEFINHEIEKDLTKEEHDNIASNMHELKIKPLHDLSSHPDLSKIDSADSNQQNTPPPVPPPIPMNFS